VRASRCRMIGRNREAGVACSLQAACVDSVQLCAECGFCIPLRAWPQSSFPSQVFMEECAATWCSATRGYVAKLQYLPMSCINTNIDVYTNNKTVDPSWIHFYWLYTMWCVQSLRLRAHRIGRGAPAPPTHIQQIWWSHKRYKVRVPIIITHAHNNKHPDDAALCTRTPHPTVLTVSLSSLRQKARQCMERLLFVPTGHFTRAGRGELWRDAKPAGAGLRSARRNLSLFRYFTKFWWACV
jgi:hypothetical protein